MGDAAASAGPAASATETVASALARGQSRLSAVAENPRLEAEILLMTVLDRDRAFLRAWPEQPLTHSELERFERFLKCRAEGQPIAYLIGEREFWSRSFRVKPGILIPRPETEHLVEVALAAIPDRESCRVLDLGTGSGAIAVTLACERPFAQVVATDISAEALSVAKENAQRLGASNVVLFRGDWFGAVPSGERFDLVISNPPYIAATDVHLETGDLRFEPRLALESGPQGLDAIDAIARAAPGWLKPDGLLILEHGFEQGEAIAALLGRLGYRAIRLHRDYQGHPRVTAAQFPEL